MRKLIISLLLVGTAATSALAQDHNGNRRDRDAQSASADDGDRAEARAERQQRRAEGQRPPREQRAERAQPPQIEAPAAAVTAEAPRRPRLAHPVESGAQQSRVLRGRRDDDSLAAQIIQMRRAQRDGTAEVHRDRSISPDRDGSRLSRNDRQWSGQWRSDQRYDWRRHRDYNRSLFRFGRYYDPYGYSYRRFSIGFSLWPSYYGSSFWLNDPWQYRLPQAYGPYRWVRYYDDALLVNVYSGEVVDVINNFFW